MAVAAVGAGEVAAGFDLLIDTIPTRHDLADAAPLLCAGLQTRDVSRAGATSVAGVHMILVRVNPTGVGG